MNVFMLNHLLSADDAERLRALLDESEHIVVTCHVSPDGDAMGAVLAFPITFGGKARTRFPLCRTSSRTS